MGRDVTKYPSMNRVAPLPPKQNNYSSTNIGDKMLKVWIRLSATAMKMGRCPYIHWGKEKMKTLGIVGQRERERELSAELQELR